MGLSLAKVEPISDSDGTSGIMSFKKALGNSNWSERREGYMRERALQTRAVKKEGEVEF